jgi:hypothetical protein
MLAWVSPLRARAVARRLLALRAVARRCERAGGAPADGRGEAASSIARAASSASFSGPLPLPPPSKRPVRPFVPGYARLRRQAPGWPRTHPESAHQPPSVPRTRRSNSSRPYLDPSPDLQSNTCKRLCCPDTMRLCSPLRNPACKPRHAKRRSGKSGACSSDPATENSQTLGAEPPRPLGARGAKVCPSSRTRPQTATSGLGSGPRERPPGRRARWNRCDFLL